MDEKMKQATESVMDNICTIAGAALMLYPLIKQATQEIAPKLEELQSGDYKKNMAALEGMTQNSKAHEKSEHDDKPTEDTIKELKQKLEELESKES